MDSRRRFQYLDHFHDQMDNCHFVCGYPILVDVKDKFIQLNYCDDFNFSLIINVGIDGRKSNKTNKFYLGETKSIETAKILSLTMRDVFFL